MLALAERDSEQSHQPTRLGGNDGEVQGRQAHARAGDHMSAYKRRQALPMHPARTMGFSLGFDGRRHKDGMRRFRCRRNIIGEGRGRPVQRIAFAGFDTAFRSLREAADESAQERKPAQAQCINVCAGLAGAGRRNVVRRVLVFLAQEISNALAQVITDYEIALEAAVGAGPGIVLIAGTGSVAYGRNAAGETARAGGYGPLGGRRRECVRDWTPRGGCGGAEQGPGPGRLPCSRIDPGSARLRRLDELTQQIMKNPEEIFPALFPVVAEAAEADDSAAKEILFTSAIRPGKSPR